MRRLTLHHVEQLAAIDTHEEIVGANTEPPAQAAQLHLIGGAKQQRRLLDNLPHLLAQCQCLGRRHQPTAGPHQDRIADGLANPSQRATHGRRAEVHPPRRAYYAPFVEQGVESDQEVHVRKLHVEHSYLI
ncbi:hypothetical protein D9M71_397520 [compost metagenome]